MRQGASAGRLSVEVFSHDSVLELHMYFFICLNYNLKVLQKSTTRSTVHIVICYYHYYHHSFIYPGFDRSIMTFPASISIQWW